MDDHGYGRHADGGQVGPRSHRCGRHRQFRVPGRWRLCHGPAARARHAGVAGVWCAAAGGVSQVARSRCGPQHRAHRAGHGHPAPCNCQPGSLGDGRGSVAAHQALHERDHLERPAPAPVCLLPQVPARDGIGAPCHGGSGPRQRGQRARQLDSDLRALRCSRHGRGGRRVGHGGIADDDGGSSPVRDRVSGTRPAARALFDGTPGRSRVDAPAARTRTSRGAAGHAGGRRVCRRHCARRAPRASIAGGTSDRFEHRRFHIHGAARYLVGRRGPRRTRDRQTGCPGRRPGGVDRAALRSSVHALRGRGLPHRPARAHWRLHHEHGSDGIRGLSPGGGGRVPALRWTSGCRNRHPPRAG